jgi:ATP-binding cassette subfamily F protein uup
VDGSGRIVEFVGGYSDWAQYRDQRAAAERAQQRNAQTTDTKSAAASVEKKLRKLSYKDQRDLDTLPAKLEALENEKAGVEAAISDPDFYSRPQDEVNKQLKRIGELTKEIETAYARWTELDALAGI